MMNRNTFFLLSLTVFFGWSCAKVPITNRRQFNLLPESELMSMSLKEYNAFLAKSKVVNDSNAVMVKRTGINISNAIASYLRSHNQAKRVSGYAWQFTLVQDNTVNAWCMPGGKVVVYSGLLPVTRDENGLAVVMGHEIAHAIARHGNERMSQQMGIELGGMALSVALSQKPQETQQVFLQVYGAGSTLGALAYSRKHETEADKLGLCFMAMAGYDPNTAVSFWERMAQSSTGNAPPVFLSTHPSDAQRIKDIKAYMPNALKYYKGSSGNTRIAPSGNGNPRPAPVPKN
jgi:predicted Zn-dependent protease